MGKAVLSNEINMLPTQRRNVGQVLFRDRFSTLFEFLDRQGKIDRIPGGNGRHNQVQARSSMHLILKGAIPEFSMFARKELAHQCMQGLPFVEPDEDAATKCFVLKIVEQERSPLQFP